MHRTVTRVGLLVDIHQFRFDDIHPHTRTQPFVQRSVHIVTSGKFVERGALDGSLLVVIVETEVVGGCLAAARNRKIIVLETAVLRHGILPVGRFAAAELAQFRRSPGIGLPGGFDQVVILLSGHHVLLVHELLYAARDVERYAGLSCRTSFGGDEYDAVRAARSVNRGRGSVLQHLDGLDIAGRKILQTTLHRHTVHNVKRFRPSVDRAGATDQNAGIGSGFHIALRDLYASRRTLQSGRNHSDLAVFEHIGLDGGHRARQIALFGRPVTDDHYIVHVVIIGDHADFHSCILPHGNGLIDHAYERENQGLTSFCIDRKTSHGIGRYTLLRIFYDNGNTCERFGIFIHHHAFDLVLGKTGRSQQQCCQ